MTRLSSKLAEISDTHLANDCRVQDRLQLVEQLVVFLDQKILPERREEKLVGPLDVLVDVVCLHRLL